MVTTPPTTPWRGRVRDRAQLLLAASIAIAVVIVGLSILLNSVVFSENVSGGSSPEVAGDVTEFTKEARRNVRGIAIRLNHADNYSSVGTIEARFRENVTGYSHVLAESYADTGSVYVNVSYDRTIENGSRVVRLTDGTFERGGAEDWTAFTDAKRIGWFTINLDAENVSETRTATLSINDTTGAELTITVRQSEDRRILVNSSVAGTTRNVTCTPANGRVLLDLTDGDSATGDCTFDGLETLDPPFGGVRFENADALEGKFSFVVNESAGLSLSVCSSGVKPCRMPALWAVEVNTNYRSSTLSHEGTYNVTVYQNP